LYRLARPKKSSEPMETTSAAGDLAVIVTACIEPATYDPRTTAATLEQLAEDGLLDTSMAVLPLLFFTQKARYRAIGDTSPAQTELGSVVEHLGYTAPRDAVVSWATCSGSDSIVEAVKRSVARGYRTVIIAGLFVSEPGHFITARNAIEDLRLETDGATVHFTQALFDSDRVLAMLASRVMEAASTEPATGVVLIGHGQPEPASKRHPAFDEQELSFLSRLKMTLAERGFPEDSIRMAWADWGTPDITSSVRHLVALGHRRVLLVPAVYPLDTLATRLDLEIAARQARVDKSVSVVLLPAWRHDDAVISEVRERVSRALTETG
jgi:protoheme ferro-lyase